MWLIRHRMAQRRAHYCGQAPAPAGPRAAKVPPRRSDCLVHRSARAGASNHAITLHAAAAHLNRMGPTAGTGITSAWQWIANEADFISCKDFGRRMPASRV